MKRTFRILLAVALLLAPLTLGNIGWASDATQTQTPEPSSKPGFQLSQFFGGILNQMQDEPAKTYDLGADVLSSIPAVVGDRECTMAPQDDATGNGDREYAYKSATVRDDLLAYIDYLGENGFEVVAGAPLGEPGEGELSAVSKEAGKRISVRLDWTLDSYHIRLSIVDGTVNGQSAAEGRDDTQADSAVLERGKMLLDGESYEEALALYDEALAGHPGVAAYHGGRGEALMWLDRPQEALDSLNTAIQLDAACWQYYHARGLVFFGIDQRENALADFTKATAIEPTDASAYLTLASTQALMGELEDAVLTCALGISDFSDSGDLWCLLGTVQVQLGHYKEAQNAYGEAIALGYPAEMIPYYNKTGEEANTASDPVIKQAVLPSGTSRLQNYEDWIRPHVEVMPFQTSILDSYLHSADLGNGLVEEAVAYPREWPARWLDGAIPAYTGAGWMFDLYVVRPHMSYAAKDLRHVAVTVYDYLPEEADAYIAGLLASGFMEVRDGQYAGDWVDRKRTFRGKDCVLNIVFAHGDGPVFRISASGDEDLEAKLPFMQFNVDFTRALYAADTTPTQGTELLNYEQWSDVMGTPVDQRQEMDQLARSEADQHGRLNETVYLPSQWPKDIFGELIPEYDLSGAMYYMDVTTPQKNPRRDQTLIATMCILEFDLGEVQEYAQRLSDFGYREVPPEEYTEQEAANAAENDILHVFALPSMRVYLAVSVDDMLYITVRFDGRYNVFFGQ